MPRLTAQTDDGQALQVHLPEMLSWVLGIAATLITGLTLWLFSTVADLDSRVGQVERVIPTVVPRAEYTQGQVNINARLDRIEDKLDRLLEGRE